MVVRMVIHYQYESKTFYYYNAGRFLMRMFK